MAIITPLAQEIRTDQPQRRAWTVAEFERAVELGLFGPEERLELIEGEIVRKVTQNPRHAVALRLAEKVFNTVFVDGYDIRIQMPLSFGSGSGNRPEPDLAVVVGAPRDFVDEHPSGAVLVLEVSDTTLMYDRTIKAAVYARAGIPELWILNLPDRVLEVCREPAAMADQPFGFHYRGITRHTEAESVTPLAALNNPVLVGDLLP